MEYDINQLLIELFAAFFACVFYLIRNKANIFQFKEIKGISIKYHYFVWSFFIPSWLISGIYDYAMNWESYQVFPLSIFAFIEFVACILLILSFIGFFKFTKYSWYCLFSEMVIEIATGVLFIIIAAFDYDFGIITVLSVILQMILRILTIIYYLKRKHLFISTSIKRNDSNSSEAYENSVCYCRKCGTKLKKDAVFCHTCGEKI